MLNKLLFYLWDVLSGEHSPINWFFWLMVIVSIVCAAMTGYSYLYDNYSYAMWGTFALLPFAYVVISLLAWGFGSFVRFFLGLFRREPRD